MSKPVRPDIYFTRHLFRAGLECPVKLFYKANNYPESKKALPFIAHNYHNKEQLKALFRCKFPEGVYINESSKSRAADKTQGEVHKEHITLFNGVFIWQDMLVKTPVLEKKGDIVNVYYIQTKAFNPAKHRLTNHRGHIHPKWIDYLTDFAFLTYVVKQLYPQWNVNPYLILPDKASITRADYLHEKLELTEHTAPVAAEIQTAAEDLLVVLDVEEQIKTVMSGAIFAGTNFEGQSFGSVAGELKKCYFSGEKYPVTVGSKCKNCEFRLSGEQALSGEINGFKECWQPETTKQPISSGEMIFDLIGPGTATWLERGLYFQQQVPLDEITHVAGIEKASGRITERQRQALQILKAKGAYVPEEIIKPQLFEELQRWEFPIHFLDFEAGNYTIPIRHNRKPYHLVVFQFSCHTLEEDGSWRHYEWIADTDNGYPNYECIRRLRRIPRIDEGTVVQYSNFERNALTITHRELRRETDEVADASELMEWIEQFISRSDSNTGNGPYLADLSRLVKNYYYNNQMGNSLSIKDVVQSVLTLSPYLKQLYSKPYNSSNFDSVIWWQPDHKQEMVRNPYSIMLGQQNETTVRRGTEAMVVYGRLLREPADKLAKKERISALLKYCELDTLAMLMIYQHWKALLERSHRN